MTTSSSSFLFIFCLIIIVAVSSAEEQQQKIPMLKNNKQKQAALCQDPSTLIYRYINNNAIYGSAAFFTPAGVPTTSGEDTSVIFPGGVGGDTEGRLMALSALAGDTDWSYITQPIMTSPVTSMSVKQGAGTSVYFGSENGRIYGVDADVGSRQWSYDTGAAVQSSPVFWSDYRANNYYVYAGSDDGQMYALKVDPKSNPDSSTLAWNFSTTDAIKGSPCITDYYYLMVFGSTNGSIFGVSPRTGRHYWTLDSGAASVTSSCTIADLKNGNAASQVIFIGDDNGNLHRIELNGKKTWTKSAGTQGLKGAPAVGTIELNGALTDVVFVGSSDNSVYCFKAEDGTPVWKYTTGGKVFSTPVLSSGSKNYQSSSTAGTESTSAPFNVLPNVATKFVYITSMDGVLYQLNASTGDALWNYTTTGGQGIAATPTLDHSTGIIYFGGIDKSFYAVLAEPSCLPTCNLIPRSSSSIAGKNQQEKIQSENVIFSKKGIDAVSTFENGDDMAFEAMRGASAWHSEAQSILFHNREFDTRTVVDGQVSSQTVSKWNSYAFFPLNQALDWEAPIRAASGATLSSKNDQNTATSPCTLSDGCETVLPCVGPALPSLSVLKQTIYTKAQYCQYWNEAALFSMFEFAVALATSKNSTYAQRIFTRRAGLLMQGASNNKTCSQSFDVAKLIANQGKSGFVCSSFSSTTDNSKSSIPHFVLTHESSANGTYSFDATAYAEQVDAAQTAASKGAYVSEEAVNLLAGAGTQSFLSYCSCSSCAPYITPDNNAVPWLFLICCAIKAVIVSFKLTSWVARFRNLFLRRRTAASSDYIDEAGDGTKNTKSIKIKKRNDPVLALREAQKEKDEQRRVNAATFFNSAEVQRRIQKVIDERTGAAANARQDDNTNNQDQDQVGRDFVKFYLNQFSAPSSSFEASSITSAFDQAGRKEKIVDVVVPDDKNGKQATEKISETLAVLDKVFENLVEARGSAGGAANISIRESQGFSGFMSSVLRTSVSGSRAGGAGAGAGGGATKAPLLRSSNTKNSVTHAGNAEYTGGYGSASDNLGQEDGPSQTALRQSQQEQDDTSAAPQQVRSSAAGSEGGIKSAKQMYYGEVRNALKAYKKLQLDHPEWFEVITVVIHRSPKNPFLPSRLVLALGAIYAFIYYIVSFIDAFLWMNYDRLVIAGEDAAHPGTATSSENWLRYEAFAWRIMNSTIFPILFVNCICANWQYTTWTKSEASIISSKMNKQDNPSASGDYLNEDDDDVDEETLSCFAKFSRFMKALSQHFEGRVAIVSFFLMLPMILTHCLASFFAYIWIIGPIVFFCIFTPAVAISHYTALLQFDAVERQYFNLNRSLKTNMSLPADQQIPNTVYHDADETNASGFCNCCSTVNSRRRSIVFFAYGIIFFFACVVLSWTFNTSLLWVYDANGSVHSGQNQNAGGASRYISAIGWEFDARSPVCAVDTYWMSSSAILRNAAVGFTPF